MLAHLPPQSSTVIWPHTFHPYTEYTLTSPEKLRSVLQYVLESGFAFASQQMEPRLCTLAVPVRDTGGHFVAGMNVILQGRLVTASEMAAPSRNRCRCRPGSVRSCPGDQPVHVFSGTPVS
jgi:IclR family pca regulon transcriptional regulator